MITMNLKDLPEELTEEEKKMLERAEKASITFDEDCPELTEEQLKQFIANVTKTFSKEINERGGIGSIAEIYDSKRPYAPKGAFAQAWSVAEVFRIILEA